MIHLSSIDLISSRDQIRKSMIFKNQYVTQRVRDAYIAILSQSEASFDLSVVAQIINSKEKDVKRLNKRLQWQLDHFIRGLIFVRLNLNQLKLMIFIDVSFVNVDLHSQIDYVICLMNNHKTNIIHWSFTKCKRVIRSVLVAELYVMTNDFDTESMIKSTMKRILNVFILLILLIDSRSLFDCLMKLDTTSKKKLMIDLMCLRQSYERREIAEICWIDEEINSVNVMIKTKLCQVLKNLIDTNTIDLKTTEWVEKVRKDTINEMNKEIIDWVNQWDDLLLFQRDFNVWSKIYQLISNELV